MIWRQDPAWDGYEVERDADLGLRGGVPPATTVCLWCGRRHRGACPDADWLLRFMEFMGRPA